TGKRFNDTFLVAKDKTVTLSKEEAAKRGCDRAKNQTGGGEYECLITGRAAIEEYLATLGDEFKPDDTHQLAFEERKKVDPQTGQTVTKAGQSTWITYYVLRTAELTGTAVADASVVFDPTTTRPEVSLKFNRQGGRRFGDVTSKNVG